MWKFISGTAPPVRAHPINTKRPANREVPRPDAPPTQLGEKVDHIEIAPDSIIASIPTTAALMTELLDDAIPSIRDLYSRARIPEGFKEHEGELKSARRLVQKVRYQKGFHTREVAVALGTLQNVVERLDASTDSLQLVKNIIEELGPARKNLLGSLPASISEAMNNRLVGGVQVNAEFGGRQSEGRAMITAIGNEASDGFQINAPVPGNTDALLKLAALYKTG